MDFLANVATVMSFRMQDRGGRMVDDKLGKAFVPARKSITLSRPSGALPIGSA